MLTWQARCLWPLLIARCDRSGIVEVQPGPRQHRALSVLLRIPEEVVTPGVEDLLADTRLVAIESGFWLRNFEEAQKARKNARLRMEETRDRRKQALRNATPGCEKQQNVLNRREEIKTSKRGAAETAAPQPPTKAKPRVVAVVDNQEKFSQTTTPTTHSSALTERERSFLGFWNQERARCGHSLETEVPDLPALRELLITADERNPALADRAVSLLVCNLFEGDFKDPSLRNLLKRTVWERRLGTAFQEIIRTDRAADSASRFRL